MKAVFGLLHSLTLALTASLPLLTSTVKAEDLSGIKISVIPQCTTQHRDEGYIHICAELLDQREIDEVKAMRFVDSLAYKPLENALILAAKLKKSELGFYDRPAFSGEISTFLEPIDADLFAIKVRFKGIEKAKLDPILFNLAGRNPIVLSIDGREPSERTAVEAWPLVLQKLQANGARFETISFPAGKHLESKEVIVFRGQHCLISIAHCKVIYSADGGQLRSFIPNAYAAHIGLDDYVLIGIPSSNDNRVGEQLKGRHQESFDAFLRFVVTDLRQSIEKGDKPKKRFVAGYSNGGAWALDALLFNPELFDGAIVMSPGSWKTKDNINVRGKQIFLGAGELEPGFFKQTQIVDKLMLDLGADVKRKYSKSGHSMNTWVPIWLLALNTLNANLR